MLVASAEIDLGCLQQQVASVAAYAVFVATKHSGPRLYQQCIAVQYSLVGQWAPYIGDSRVSAARPYGLVGQGVELQEM